MIAARNGRMKGVQLLVDFGAQIDVAYEDGVTPLVMACNRY